MLGDLILIVLAVLGAVNGLLVISLAGQVKTLRQRVDVMHKRQQRMLDASSPNGPRKEPAMRETV